MSIGPMPICLKCARLKKTLFKYHCEAFPEGIPEAILVGGYDHRKEYPGDNGILFEPKKDK